MIIVYRFDQYSVAENLMHSQQTDNPDLPLRHHYPGFSSNSPYSFSMHSTFSKMLSTKKPIRSARPHHQNGSMLMGEIPSQQVSVLGSFNRDPHGIRCWNALLCDISQSPLNLPTKTNLTVWIIIDQVSHPVLPTTLASSGIEFGLAEPEFPFFKQ